MSGHPRSWWIALGIAAIVGIALRVHNALVYPIGMGYDAAGNWDYISLLLQSWALPAPEQGWSTAHPPFFYYLAATIAWLVDPTDKPAAIHAIRLVSAASGLVGIWFAVLVVRRADPGNARRAFIAGALLLFLPVHLYMSAMLSEEILVTALISVVAAGVALDSLEPSPPDRSRRALLLGVVAGLALLTKLSGLLIVGAGTLAYLIGGRDSDDKLARVARATVFAMGALVVGGWFYVWNLLTHGYLYPHGLEVHSVMFRMPPGERFVSDYLWIPWQTLSAPELLSPKLLHSVWGSTYVTIWFDGHRHFLPRSGATLMHFGTALLILGLVPTCAFLVGLSRGLRRLARSLRGPDLVMLVLVVSTLAGYVLFTWRNPWFVVLKGSFLLGLSVPFSYYASEVLASWTRGRNGRSAVLLASLGLLMALVMVGFSYGFVFEKHELPGIEWSPVETPWQG